MKWLLTKSYNNKVPPELREPFYKDHDVSAVFPVLAYHGAKSVSFQGIERLKPHVVHSLANAEFYCMVLSNLYADPNYHNLNHWGVIQALARKGIDVVEPVDCSLTETVLIQTTPLKLVRGHRPRTKHQQTFI